MDSSTGFLLFPVKSAEDILDYDYQDISGHTFLLPLKATVTMNGGNSLSRNDKQFRRYQKYSADTIIKYDSDTASHPDDEKPR